VCQADFWLHNGELSFSPEDSCKSRNWTSVGLKDVLKKSRVDQAVGSLRVVFAQNGNPLETKDLKIHYPNPDLLLQVAESKGPVEIELLLHDGHSVNAAQIGTLRTPLMYAVAAGNEPVVKFLLGKGADVAARDFQGDDALSLAEAKQNRKIIEILRKASKSGAGGPH